MTDHFSLSPTELRLALRERGYDPVPVSGASMNVASAGKRPVMPKWQTRCFEPPLEDIRRWEKQYPDSINTGLLCGALVGIDIDIPDPQLADAAEAHCCSRLGSTSSTRYGNAPKRMLCYRTRTPFNKLQTASLLFTDDPDEKPTRVEVLGRGQQFVAFGIHPQTGRPYHWPNSSPLTLGLDELPEITEPLLRQVLGEVEELMRWNGGATTKERKRNRAREEEGWKSSGFQSQEKPDRETIAEALQSIPNDFDYDDWIRIGFALYAALGVDGRELWEWWSATSPKNDPLLTAQKWPSFAQRRSVTAGTLFYYATQAGWRRGGRPRAPKSGPAEQLASSDPNTEPRERDGRPIVRLIAGKVPESVDQMEKILLNAGVQIYARGGALVRPVTETIPDANGRATFAARMVPLTAISLADIAAQVTRFQRFDRRAQDWCDINPPAEVTATLLERVGQWRIPTVAGVITTPTLRPDGSLLSTPGYDPTTRLFLALDPGFVMPQLTDYPNQAEARSALAYIEALLVGFPFMGPTDRAVALSGLLTALVRGVIPTAPLHAIRAHTPGTGKSYLVDLVSVIATGRRCPVIAAGKTEEETEKRLGALLREAVPIVSIDNVNGELGGDALCQMTERPLVRVRILGKSEAPELECRSTVFATGNNMVLLGDMVRRALVCSLDSGLERPELRTYDNDPLTTVLANRGNYVGAALTVLRAYITAGSPRVCGPIGSYAEWSETVRASLIWLGQPDPVDSMEQAREEDPELCAIRELHMHWQEHLGLLSHHTTSAIIKTACEREGFPSLSGLGRFTKPDFHELLLRQAGDGSEINSRRLGKWLSRVKGRVVDGYRLVVQADAKHGHRFALVPAE